MTFVDQVQITLTSGQGGAGAVHFHRTKHHPRGGPDGGHGGCGGDVIVSPRSSLQSLSHLTDKKIYKAQDGAPGKGGRQKGAKGKSLYLSVPPHTFCYDREKKLLKEITSDNWCLLKGGKGGKGNIFFKSSRRQAPLQAQAGTAGQRKSLILEMKWPSYAAFIGRQSVGKTSFLQNLCKDSQKPLKTRRTLYPQQVSIAPIPRENQEGSINKPLVFVDLPGLNSSTWRFLTQVERTKLLIFVLSVNDTDVFLSYQTLKKQLQDYDKKNHTLISQKPSLVVLLGKAQNHLSSVASLSLFRQAKIPVWPADKPLSVNHRHEFLSFVSQKIPSS